MADRYCCIAGGMYRYDEEPDGRQLYVTLEDYEQALRWVADLQSGMYVNCVYCGHRFGPGETTPVSMADALKAHVEKCPAHPMAALARDAARYRWLRDGNAYAPEEDGVNGGEDLDRLCDEYMEGDEDTAAAQPLLHRQV